MSSLVLTWPRLLSLSTLTSICMLASRPWKFCAPPFVQVDGQGEAHGMKHERPTLKSFCRLQSSDEDCSVAVQALGCTMTPAGIS